MVGVVAVSLALVLSLAACAGDSPAPAEADQLPPSSGELGEGLTVVATLFPLAWMAEQIAPGAEIVFLGARGQDPHDLELSPGDRTHLETADLVLYLGDLGFQPQIEAALAERQGHVVDVRSVLGDERFHEIDEDEHADDHGHEDEEEGLDPHVWFDVGAMAVVATDIGEAFAEIDPTHAARYRDRTQRLSDALAEADAEFDEVLTGCRLDTAIVSHEAYAYLLQPRGFRQEGISGAGGHSEASPQRLAELTQRIREEGIPAVLAEPFEGRADAEALAIEAGVDLLDIDPLEIVTADMYATGYLELLREQVRAFATALDCSDDT